MFSIKRGDLKLYACFYGHRYGTCEDPAFCYAFARNEKEATKKSLSVAKKEQAALYARYMDTYQEAVLKRDRERAKYYKHQLMSHPGEPSAKDIAVWEIPEHEIAL